MAAIIRVLHLVDHLGSSLSAPEQVESFDMHGFATWARQIAGGDLVGADSHHPFPEWMAEIAPLETFERWWGGREVFHQEPLYAYLLAVSYALSGGKLLMLLAQVAGSVLAVVLVYRIGSRVASKDAGLFAAGLFAVYAPSVVYDTLLLRESLTVSLTVAAIWLLLRVRDTGRRGVAIGAGAALAASYFMRPTGLALLLVGPLLISLDRSARRSWRRWVPGLLTGVLIVAAPFVVRNLIVHVPPLSFSNRGPETVIHGNHAGADPGLLVLPAPDEYRRLMEEGHGSVGRALVASVRSWPEDGRLRWWAWHVARKMVATFQDHEYADNANFSFYRRATPALAFLPTFGWICGLMGVGTVLLARRRVDPTAAALIAVPAVASILLILLTFAGGRYRLPLAVLGTIPAGVALSAMVGWLSQRRWLPLAGAALMASALSAASFLTGPPRIVFDQFERPHFIRGADARLYEDLAAWRVLEFMHAARQANDRGDPATATDEVRGYLTGLRRIVTEAPAPDEQYIRRIVINFTYVQLLGARETFVEIGRPDLADAVDVELAWIRDNT